MTTYWAKVRYHATGHVVVLTYNAATTRALALILVSPYATVLEEGMGTAPEVIQ